MDSIIQNEKECFFCGSQCDLECHHVLGGTANRKLSEKYGLKVWLCRRHHTGADGAQYDIVKNMQLKRVAQKRFEALHGHDRWMEVFGKNYI